MVAKLLLQMMINQRRRLQPLQVQVFPVPSLQCRLLTQRMIRLPVLQRWWHLVGHQVLLHRVMGGLGWMMQRLRLLNQLPQPPKLLLEM